MKLPTLREIGTEARLLLIGIPVFIWTMVPIYHMFLFAISPKEDAFSGKLWPTHPTLHNFHIVFYQQHYFLRDFWIQFWNSLVIAVSAGALTLVVATAAAFAISRLRVPGGRWVMNLALLTYFIPAAFLAVPMYRTMGNYGLLNNHWSLILAMVTIASPYAIWVLKQASDKLPVELDEAAVMDGATTLAAFPPGLSAADDAVAGRDRHLCAAARLERISLRVPAAVERHRDHAAGRARQLPLRRQFAVGTADDHRLHLRAAAGRDLLRLQALHGGRAHCGCGEVVTTQTPSFRGDAKHRTTMCDCTSENASQIPVRSCERPGMTVAHNGAALLPSALESFEAAEATTITTAISAITSAQMALISGFTPSRTSE